MELILIPRHFYHMDLMELLWGRMRKSEEIVSYIIR